MSTKAIAVLGAGNGGCMMAVDLTQRGYDVHLCEHPEFGGAFQQIQDKGAIDASGIGPIGTFKIARLGTSIQDALEDVEWIHLAMCAVGHEAFFRVLVPHLRDGQKIMVWAGDFASLSLLRHIRESRKRISVTLFEGNTLPYGTRKVGPTHVQLLLRATEVLVGSIPPESAGDFEALKIQFPTVKRVRHVLEAAFNNPNPIVHPPGSLLNTGRIEFSHGDFYMYHEGITESVARVVRSVYEESRAVARALGFDMRQYRDIDFRTKCSIMGAAFEAPFDTCGVIGAIRGPTSLASRYVTEDVPCGLVPRSEFGRLVGVPTPVIDGLVAIGSAVRGEDYRKTGRTLAALGLLEMTPQQIAQLLEKGPDELRRV